MSNCPVTRCMEPFTAAWVHLSLAMYALCVGPNVEFKGHIVAFKGHITASFEAAHCITSTASSASCNPFEATSGSFTLVV